MRKKESTFELADIFRGFWIGFTQTHLVTRHHFRIVNHIINCRTSRMGFHLEKCSSKDCDYETIAYDSCRDRQCPKCQGSKRLRWVADRMKELLPIPYYHFVSTMPPMNHRLCLFNQALIYDLFFKATSYALNAFSKDPKFLGAQLGFVGVLHTWGKSLAYHPHIHYIVTGGGLLRDGTWKQLPYQHKFIFPVKALSRTIRGRFIKLLKQAYSEGKLSFPGKLNSISSPHAFQKYCNKLGNQSWYCYAKKPFSGPQSVLEYIGRYTHRVAISNNRLIGIENGQVIFKEKDYKDEGKIKVTSLPVYTFIRRFLWHVLPPGFRKIRHFGFLKSGSRSEKIEMIRTFLEDVAASIDDVINTWLDKMSPFINNLCPKCQKASLEFIYDTS